MLPVTDNTLFSLQLSDLRANLVVKIEGYPIAFGAKLIKTYVRIGDAGLEIDNYLGDPWKIGGFRTLENQKPLIEFSGSGGTTSQIQQQIQPDKGISSGVSAMDVLLVDKNAIVSKMISPGFDLNDILAKKVDVYFGFAETTSFPQDYLPIFRGFISDFASGPAAVKLTLSSFDDMRRGVIFPRAQGKITGAIAPSGAVSSITLDQVDFMLQPQPSPFGGFDSDISYYVQIDQEVFSYTSITGTTLNGVVRAQLGTSMQTHDADTGADMLVRLQTTAGIRLVQKIMQSGKNGPYVTGIPVTSFVRVSPTETVPNSMFFYEVDVADTYGLTVGDFVSNSGSAFGANNFTLKQIAEIVKTNDGSYITLSAVSFVEETTGSTPIADFRSQWDSLGYGMKMDPRMIDNAEYDRLYRLFLSSFGFDFQLLEYGSGADFIDQQIMAPMGCYTVPRKARVSCAYHIGPIPGAELVVFDVDNVDEPQKIEIKRSTTQNIYNTVRFQFDRDLQGNYDSVFQKDDAASKADIPINDRTLEILSDGMRTSLQGASKAEASASRYVTRYGRGAEYIDKISVLPKDAVRVEIADIVLVDTKDLNITDTRSGTRGGSKRLFEIQNKNWNLDTQKVDFKIVDTEFSTTARYCLISPATNVRTAIDASSFSMGNYYKSAFGANEFLKWQRFGPISVRVRSPSLSDFSPHNAIGSLISTSGNIAQFSPALPFTPAVNDVMEFPHYDDATQRMTAVYGFMTDNPTFSDGRPQYRML